MSNSQVFEAEGVVVENLPNTTFRVQLKDTNEIIMCTLSGKMRIHWVRLLPGDKVKVDVSKLDPTKGRVVYKIK